MKSKRLPDRVHVVRPPSEEYGGQPLQSMGDHTREIVRALAQISDKLKRSEVEREEMRRELKQTREILSDIEDKAESGQKAYLSLEHQIKNRDAIEGDMTARQARFEKSLKAAEDKLVKAVAGQAVLDQKIKDSESRSLALNERIDEAVTHQTRFDRRLEAISQDKSRMLRKVERLEEVVTETQDAMKAKAMVLLTDQSTAAQGALQAPSWYDGEHQNQNEVMADVPWWRSPMRMQALGTASMVVAALLTGWMINHVQQPDTPQIAVVDGASLARFNADGNTWEPLVLDNEVVPSSRLNELAELESQKLSERLQPAEIAETIENVEATPIDVPVQTEQIVPEEEPFDYTNDQQLLEALENNPDQLAANLNNIEPGIQEALEVTPEPDVVEAQPATEEPVQLASAVTPENFEQQALQQDPSVANDIRNDRGLEPLSQRAQRDPNLPDLLKDYEDQAIKGVASAQHDLAAVYTAGRGGVEQDFTRAAFWFEEAANNGIANASYNLGVLNHQGLGVEQDLTKAMYWYREAAQSNHPEAQYNLGIAHIEGIGTDYNPQLAATFFERSAQGGIMEAAYNLGLIHENGLLGQANNEEALYWYKMAADDGNQDAQNALNQLAAKLQVGADDIDNMVARKTQIQRSESAPATVQNTAYSDNQAIIAQIQERLTVLDLYPGPSDGIMGPKTADAIRTYQSENGLAVTGQADRDLLLHLMSRGL
ncbi:MAG: peptidoglycan-binding protein [Pseudomonadota bacterium]